MKPPGTIVRTVVEIWKAVAILEELRHMDTMLIDGWKGPEFKV
jgi:hypothetical protein